MHARILRRSRRRSRKRNRWPEPGRQGCPATRTGTTLVQTVLKWSQDGSNHPRFTEKDLLAIPVPDHVHNIQAEVNKLVRSAIAAKQESTNLLERAKRAIEDSIGSPGDQKTS